MQLTESGKALLARVLPVWDAVTAAMEQLVAEEPGFKTLLPAITSLENTFKSSNLAAMIGENLQAVKTEEHEQV